MSKKIGYEKTVTVLMLKLSIQIININIYKTREVIITESLILIMLHSHDKTMTEKGLTITYT